MKSKGNAFEALFHHPGKESESKAVSEDKQQEARSSPSHAEVVKQEEEVPLGLRNRKCSWDSGRAQGRGWQSRRSRPFCGRPSPSPSLAMPP